MAVNITLQKSDPDKTGKVVLRARVRSTKTGGIPPSEKQVSFSRAGSVFTTVPLNGKGEAASPPVEDGHVFWARSLPSGTQSNVIPQAKERVPRSAGSPEPAREEKKAAARSTLHVRLSTVRDREREGLVRIFIQLTDGEGRSVERKEKLRIVNPGEPRGYAVRMTREDGGYTYLVVHRPGEPERLVVVEVLRSGARDFVNIR